MDADRALIHTGNTDGLYFRLSIQWNLRPCDQRWISLEREGLPQPRGVGEQVERLWSELCQPTGLQEAWVHLPGSAEHSPSREPAGSWGDNDTNSSWASLLLVTGNTGFVELIIPSLYLCGFQNFREPSFLCEENQPSFILSHKSNKIKVAQLVITPWLED